MGKAMINILPLEQGETISTILPLPKDQSEVDKMSIVFATSHGTVRRNSLTDFLNVRANGKIAMKLDEDFRGGRTKAEGRAKETGEGLKGIRSHRCDQDSPCPAVIPV